MCGTMGWPRVHEHQDSHVQSEEVRRQDPHQNHLPQRPPPRHQGVDRHVADLQLHAQLHDASKLRD